MSHMRHSYEGMAPLMASTPHSQACLKCHPPSAGPPPPSQNTHCRAGEGGSKKRKRGFKGPSGGGGLSVPVICTANDAYAPCLRPLRDIAAVYHFKPPAADKLASRLGAIAAAEGLSLDKQVGSSTQGIGWGGMGACRASKGAVESDVVTNMCTLAGGIQSWGLEWCSC
jgi:hypothetical protein